MEPDLLLPQVVAFIHGGTGRGALLGLGGVALIALLKSFLAPVGAMSWDRQMRLRGITDEDRTRVFLEKARKAQGLPPPGRPSEEE